MTNRELWEYAIERYEEDGLWLGYDKSDESVQIRKHGWLKEVFSITKGYPVIMWEDRLCKAN